MKLIYALIALAATVIAAPAPVEIAKKDVHAHTHTRHSTKTAWDGNYNDEYDDDWRGHKDFPAVNIGDPCEAGTDKSFCSPPDSNGVSKLHQCHDLKGWQILQCDCLKSDKLQDGN
ncbi:UNVERIFIED_CONTAM: hypothetical protein HDU68_009000 [Siphonaria sp. JEL0065]|nr:hypothetical protein HDU68_009000 [Siphonaria sp. JEL0065]